MNIVILGGTGFVGSALARNFSKNGNNVIIISHSKSPSSSSLTTLEDFLRNCGKISIDYLFDCRWSNLNDYQSEEHLLLPGSFMRDIENIFKKSKTVKKISSFGTCLEYGNRNGEITEEHIIDPETNYAIAKIEYSKKLKNFCSSNEIFFLWFRLFYIYGEGRKKSNLYETIIESSNNSEEVNLTCALQVRDYLHIDEVAEMVEKVLKSNFSGEINICSGKGVKLRDLIMKWVEELKLNVKLNFCAIRTPAHEKSSFWGSNKLFLSHVKKSYDS